MPLYDFKCPAGHVTESLQKVSVNAIFCPTCGAPAGRQIPRLAPPVLDQPPYYDHGLGTVIRSRAQRRALMRANNLVEKGSTARHGAKGTIFSHPGQATTSVPPSGAYTGPLKAR